MKFFWIILLLPFSLCAQQADSVKTLNYLDPNGLKQGAWQEKCWFPAIADSLICTFTYVNSQLCGPCSCSYPDGKKACSGKYVNGNANGYWLYFKPNGEMDHTATYKDGEILQQLYYTYKTGADGNPELQKLTHKNKYNKTTIVEHYENNVMVKSEEHVFGTGEIKADFIRTLNLKGPWAISTGYTYQNSHWLELGVKKYCSLVREDEGDFLQSNTYVLVGADLNYRDKNLQVAPKIGIGHQNFFFLDFNLNCILYNDRFQTFNPALTPEIGISFPLGIVQINYGYNIFLGDRDAAFMKNERNRISLHINIPFFKTGKFAEYRIN